MLFAVDLADDTTEGPRPAPPRAPAAGAAAGAWALATEATRIKTAKPQSVFPNHILVCI
jgi:hypothetical protein